MILDSLQRAQLYFSLHPLFKEAFTFLRKEAFQPGKHPFGNQGMFYLYDEIDGKGRGGVFLEAHQKYIDIQLILEGVDEMGCRALEDCRDISTPYNREKDIVYYRDPPLFWMPVFAENFAIFFPHDAHAPLGGTTPLRKVVIKVPL